ncbi:MAG TPA: hypothetical protein VFV99_30465 [Kofleriaceae bacterium]|nr:hypothetical protein [Kofleriaceae bacterium]
MKHVYPLVLLLAGCTSGLTTDPQPVVSVLKQDGDCFALMTVDSPISPILGISGTCNYTATPKLFAGADFIEVVVDYGDVAFSGTTSAPRPDVVVTVDGVVSDVPIEISDEYRIGGHAYFIATFYAPLESSSNVRISAGVNAGFQTVSPVVFSTIPPPVGFTLLDCAQGSQCDLPGATGSAHVFISVPGQVSQLVSIHAVLGGITQPDPVPPARTQVVLGHSEVTTAVPIPNAPDQTTWVLAAQLGDGIPTEVSATIRAPTLITKLSCGTACNLAPGDVVGLDITAPTGIRPLEALVDTRINGVPQLVGAPVTLVQHADGTAVGALALTAPTTTGSWQIDVTIAGYPAPAIVTSVQ